MVIENGQHKIAITEIELDVDREKRDHGDKKDKHDKDDKYDKNNQHDKDDDEWDD